MAKRHWMKEAFKPEHRGLFKAKAARAGESTGAFARHVLAKGSNATTKTKRQAALAERGIEASHKRQHALYGA